MISVRVIIKVYLTFISKTKVYKLQSLVGLKVIICLSFFFFVRLVTGARLLPKFKVSHSLSMFPIRFKSLFLLCMIL